MLTSENHAARHADVFNLAVDGFEAAARCRARVEVVVPVPGELERAATRGKLVVVEFLVVQQLGSKDSGERVHRLARQAVPYRDKVAQEEEEDKETQKEGNQAKKKGCLKPVWSVPGLVRLLMQASSWVREKVLCVRWLPVYIYSRPWLEKCVYGSRGTVIFLRWSARICGPSRRMARDKTKTYHHN